MQDPPPLPNQKNPEQDRLIRRVLSVAKLDGWSMLCIASCALALFLINKDWIGVIACIFACAASGVELTGAKKVSDGQKQGFDYLRLSQIGIMTVIVGYATAKLWFGVPDYLIEAIRDNPLIQSQMDMAMVTPTALEGMIHLSFKITYGILILVALVFQGSMWLYYRRSERKLASYFPS